jgi:hypothetical protein
LTGSGDTEIMLDLRHANEIRFTTPKPAEPLNNGIAMAYQRSSVGDESFAGLVDAVSTTRLWANPTEQVSVGGFRFWTQALLGEPQVALAVREPGGPTLHPVSPQHWSYPLGDGSGGQHLVQDGHPGWVPFTGAQDLPLVDAGTGSAGDLEGLDLAGKLALLEVDGSYDNPLGGKTCGIDVVRIQQVRDAAWSRYHSSVGRPLWSVLMVVRR